MPYWSFEEEKRLMNMVEENKSLELISKTFCRSPEAVKLKIKRLGLKPPEPLGRKEHDKVTVKATTTPKLEAVPFSELPSIQEALQLLWAAVKRLQQPNVSSQETKKIRLLLTAIKSYIHLEADYLFRMKNVEKAMLQSLRSQIEHFKVFLEKAQTKEEKSYWQQEIKKLEDPVRNMSRTLKG